MTVYLRAEEVLLVGSIACGFQVEIGEPHQFEANILRPQSTAFGEDAFTTLWDKAAALLHGFATTQTLLDGNKRTAWASCWLFLRLNNCVDELQGQVDADAAEQLVLQTAEGKLSVKEIAVQLEKLGRK